MHHRAPNPTDGGWIELRFDPTGDGLHFCSWQCLLMYGARQPDVEQTDL